MVNFIYDLPIFRSTQNHFTHTVLGGWEIAAIGTMESGLPLFLTLSGSQGNNGVSGGTNRPDLTGSVNYPGTSVASLRGSFAIPALGAWGNMGKGTVRGPWSRQLEHFALQELRHQRVSSQPFRTPCRNFQYASTTPNSAMSEHNSETLSSVR